MKALVGLIVLFCMATSLLASEGNPGNQFTVIGEYVSDLENASQTVQDGERSDLSPVRVVLSTERLRANGKTESIELVSGQFIEGMVVLEGEIDEPTEVEITVYVNKDQKLSATALIEPAGERVSFVFIDREETEFDQLFLLGSSRRSKDPTREFSIHGKYEPRNSGTSKTIHWVTVTSEEFAADGTMAQIEFATVMVEDGEFLIEAEVNEPRVAEISVYKGSEQEYPVSGTYIVVEPGAKIRFARLGPGAGEGILAATSNIGRQSKLLDSWRVSPKYLQANDAYYEAQDRHFDGRNTHEVLAEQNEDEEGNQKSTENESSNESVIGASTNSSEDSETMEQAFAIQPTLAEGCEHVALTEVIPGYQGFDPDAPNPKPRYEYQVLWQEVARIKRESLKDSAWNSQDPFDSLVALELGRKYWSWGDVDQTDILRLYDKLAMLHDDDVVARRIQPARDSLAGSLDRLFNNKRLVPGQKVPQFRLANLEDEVVALADVIASNEMVLVDFWASWCGPCIAAFPTLKELRTNYGGDGFEIVSISIDDTLEEWEESSAKHDLPWIDLGETMGYDASSAIDYGVTFLPKTYLIDKNRCILQKDIEPEQLKEFVATRFSQEAD